MSDSAHTEDTLLVALRATYGFTNDRPRYVCAFHVNDGAGYSYGRCLDAIVFDTWPSDGLRLHGFEVKISASDFRRELQDTRKAAAFLPMLDTFSILAPRGIVDREILPKAWGLYHPTDDGRVKAARKPLMLHTDGKRDDVDRSLMAAFSRALVQRSLSQEAEREAYDRGVKQGSASAAVRLEQAEGQAASLQTSVNEFEAASGVQITRYNGRAAGEAFRAFNKLRGTGWMASLPIDPLRRALSTLEDSVADLETLRQHLGDGPDEVADALRVHAGGRAVAS
jgi:hypothetical protein